jgi:hypothetical protein
VGVLVVVLQSRTPRLVRFMVNARGVGSRAVELLVSEPRGAPVVAREL